MAVVARSTCPRMMLEGMGGRLRRLSEELVRVPMCPDEQGFQTGPQAPMGLIYRQWRSPGARPPVRRAPCTAAGPTSSRCTHTDVPRENVRSTGMLGLLRFGPTASTSVTGAFTDRFEYLGLPQTSWRVTLYGFV